MFWNWKKFIAGLACATVLYTSSGVAEAFAATPATHLIAVASITRPAANILFAQEALADRAVPALQSYSPKLHAQLLDLLANNEFKHFSEVDPVEGLNHQNLKLFDGLNVVILDHSKRPGQPLYANAMKVLRNRGAKLAVVDLDSPNAWSKLHDAYPHLIIGPRYDAEADALGRQVVQALKKDIGILYYRHPLTRIPETILGVDANPNLSVGISAQDMVIVRKAVDAYVSQKRTPYGPAVEHLMRADALLAKILDLIPPSELEKAPYRKNLVRIRITSDGTIHNSPKRQHLVISDVQPVGEEIIWIPKGATIIANDPHPDDLAINYGIAIRWLLKLSVWIINIIHGTGQNGVTRTYLLPFAQALVDSGDYSNVDQAIQALKTTIRIPESQNSGNVLGEGASGSIKVVALNLDLDPESKSDRETRIKKFVPVVQETYQTYLREFMSRFPGAPWTIFVDHPFDIHYWHQRTAEYDLLALQNLARKYGIEINVLLYPGTWNGDENVYIQSMENEPLPTHLMHDALLSAVHEALSFAKQGFADVLWEICSVFVFGNPNFGLQAPAEVKEWGGPFAERFKGDVIRYIAPTYAHTRNLGDNMNAGSEDANAMASDRERRPIGKNPFLARSWEIFEAERGVLEAARQLHLQPMGLSPDLVTYGTRRYEVRFWRTPDWTGDPDLGECLVQLGPLVFIDEDLYKKLGWAASRTAGFQIIRIRNFANRNVDSNQGGIHFSITAIVGLMQLDLRGRVVLDVGAGDGIIGMAAVALGADFVVLAENDSVLLDQARENIRLNHLEGKVKVVSVDLHDNQAVRNLLSGIPLQNVVVVGNIATYAGFSANNGDIIQNIASASEVTNLILAGYQLGLETAKKPFEDQDRWLAILGMDMGLAKKVGWYTDETLIGWPNYSPSAIAILFRRDKAHLRPAIASTNGTQAASRVRATLTQIRRAQIQGNARQVRKLDDKLTKIYTRKSPPQEMRYFTPILRALWARIYELPLKSLTSLTTPDILEELWNPIERGLEIFIKVHRYSPANRGIPDEQMAEDLTGADLSMVSQMIEVALTTFRESLGKGESRAWALTKANSKAKETILRLHAVYNEKVRQLYLAHKARRTIATVARNSRAAA